MYVPKHFEQNDDATLFDFIDAHAFGTLITTAGATPFASHVPFLLDRAARKLHCHLARPNPQWQQVAEAPEAYRAAIDREGLVQALRRLGVDTSFVERLA